MTLNTSGIQYICENFGNTSFCCINTGLSWYYTVSGSNYNETGGTAQIVSRLASGLVDSLTMTNPARGTFTKAQLDAANGATVTLQDAQTITQHDESSEDQWCYIPCSSHTDQNTCENIYGCYWWNGGCYDSAPSCTQINNQSDCTRYGCYWFNGSCHASPPTCSEINTQSECASFGCYWYNGSCHASAPTCPILNNQPECVSYGCFWYRNECHTSDQPELCYWIDANWPLSISSVFAIVDSYLFSSPPSGWSFIPTIQNVFGVIDYYLGFNGDAQTGCGIMS